MVNRNHVLTTGEFYHIYNRGNSKQNIFLDEQDYIIFQQLLYLMNMESRITLRDAGTDIFDYNRTNQLVSIGSYSIMPNHIHILVKQISNDGISKFMQKVSTGYAGYFNKKYKRTGGLFEGTFKSKHIFNDTYLKYLYTYIHLNPLKIVNPQWKDHIKIGKSVDYSFPLNYKFSSIIDYSVSERREGNILNKEDFPEYFISRDEFTNDLLSYFRG